MAAERLRRILLKEMGITSWFPRTQLPGAALSHEQCLQNFLDSSGVGQPSDAARSAVTANSNQSRPVNTIAASVLVQGSANGHGGGLSDHTAATSPTVTQLAELLAKKPAVPAPAPAAQAPAADIAGSQSALQAGTGMHVEEVGAFGFSWFNIDKRLAVLAMLPAGNSRLTSTCQQMLARLLAALYTPWQSLVLNDNNFHWPFAADLGLPADASAARQAVDGFIARRLREQNCAMLLVLCDGLPWFLEQPGVNETGKNASEEADSAQLRIHRHFGFAMLATHSLHAMEKDAGLKREAWQSMQLLRDRLNR